MTKNSDQESNLKSDQKILLLIKNDNEITIKEICHKLSMSESGVKKVMKKLKDNNVLKRVGSLRHAEIDKSSIFTKDIASVSRRRICSIVGTI